MQLKELFIKLLEFKSITPNDDGCMSFIKSYLSDFQAIDINIKDTKNLFLYKKFGDGVHLNFAGHIDVVPPGEGWQTPPFNPTYKNGYIYARGSQDMKSGVAAFLKTCKDIKNFNGTISIILTSDEEGDAQYGTIEVLKYLKEKNFLPQYSIVAEPTCDKVFGDTIKIGRRGSINAKVSIKGKQGHAAYPQLSINPIHQFAPLLDKIANHDFDKGDEFFAPSKLVMTDIRAGMQVTNVTPNELSFMFNVRNSTKTSKEDVKNYIQQILQGLDYELTLTQGAFPFISKQSILVQNLINSVKKITNETPTLSTSGGTSDARLLAQYNINCIEFGTKNDSIHAVNEKVLFKEVQLLHEVFNDLLSNFKS